MTLEQRVAQALGEQAMQILGLSVKLDEAQARIQALEAEAKAKADAESGASISKTVNGKAIETPAG